MVFLFCAVESAGQRALCVVQGVPSLPCVGDDRKKSTAPHLKTRTSRSKSIVLICTFRSWVLSDTFIASRSVLTKCAYNAVFPNLIAIETTPDNESRHSSWPPKPSTFPAFAMHSYHPSGKLLRGIKLKPRLASPATSCLCIVLVPTSTEEDAK